MPCYYIKAFKQTPYSLRHSSLTAGDAFLSTSQSWHAKMHSHPHVELLYITEGRGQVLLDSQHYAVRKDDLVIINPAVRHCESFSRSQRCGQQFEMFSCEIQGIETGFLPPGLLLPPSCSPVIATGKYVNSFLSCFSQLFEQHMRGELWYAQICNNLSNEIVLLTLRLLNDLYAVLPREQDFYDGVRIREYIDAHFCEDICPASIASTMRVNRSSLSHVFQKNAKTTITRYIHRKRIDLAKYLVCNTDQPIQNIAYRVGYLNYSHFYRMFKRLLRVSPSAYRRRYGMPQFPQSPDPFAEGGANVSVQLSMHRDV